MQHSRTAALLAVCALGIVGAAATGEEQRARMRELIEVTGMADAVRALPVMAQQQAATAFGASDEVGQAFSSAFVASFASEAMLARILDELVANHAEGHAEAVRDWYSASLGKRMRSAESALNTAAAQSQLGAYAEGLQLNPPPQNRMVLVARMDEVTDATDHLMAVTLAFSRSFTSGIMRAVAPDDPAARAEDEATLEQMRSQMRPLLQGQLRLTLLFLMRNFTDEEVGAYLSFYESDAYQWYNRHVSRGFEEALTDSAERLGSSLGPVITAQFDDESKQRIASQGESFGRGREDRECLGEGLRRDAECTGLGCHVESAAFLAACLEASERRSDVCAGVPPIDELAATVVWRAQQCTQLGRSDPFCQVLMGELQGYCKDSHQKQGV